MKSSELKAIIESQRYMIASLYTSLSLVETTDTNLLCMKLALEKMWETTEIIDASFKLGAMNLEQIFQHGKEIVALQKLYKLSEYDKSEIN